MAVSSEVGGAVNAFGRVMSRVGSAVSQRSPGLALLALAEVTLAQMGIPGALACCEYLTGWVGGLRKRLAVRGRRSRPL